MITRLTVKYAVRRVIIAGGRSRVDSTPAQRRAPADLETRGPTGAFASNTLDQAAWTAPSPAAAMTAWYSARDILIRISAEMTAAAAKQVAAMKPLDAECA
jgi:hypothetical protein